MPEAVNSSPLGVFGGTFDPVHYGHLRLAEDAADALRLPSVRWIPAGQPALRNAPRVSAGGRLAMVRLAVAGNPRFEVDSAEVEAPQTSYTVTTLERLRGACGNARPLVLLLGADAFARISEWHRWREVFELAHVAVAERPGMAGLASHKLPPLLASLWEQRFCADPDALAQSPSGRIVSFAMTQLDISATAIRALLSNGQSARYLLPDALLAYIRDHDLYQDHTH